VESLDTDSVLGQTHLFLLSGAAPIAANAFDHSLYIEQLQDENSRLHEALDFRHGLSSLPRYHRFTVRFVKFPFEANSGN
jgi:hypothetical protein